MQNYCKTISALAATSAFAASNVMAGPAPTTYEEPAPASVESGIDAEIHVGYHTKYIFRGIELGDDLIDAGFDIGTSIGGFDVSAGAWYGSFNSNSVINATFDADELDIYAEVSRDLGFATLAVGYIYYHFPQGDLNALLNPFQDAQEVYVSASREIFGIDASITYFWDIETDNDGYSEISLSKSFDLMPSVSLNVGADTGYLVEEGDFVHTTATVGIDFAATEHATISTYVAHTWTLSEGGTLAGGAGGVSTALYSGLENEFFAGASIAVSF